MLTPETIAMAQSGYLMHLITGCILCAIILGVVAYGYYMTSNNDEGYMVLAVGLVGLVMIGSCLRTDYIKYQDPVSALKIQHYTRGGIQFNINKE